MKSFPIPLTAKEESILLERMNTGPEASEGELLQAKEARNELIERNLRLVAHIVKKYNHADRDMDDLISIGTIGLIKAVDTYNADKGIRLATYASRCIDNAILSQMRLWLQTSPPRAEKNQNGVFWHRFPKTFTSFAPLRTAM